MALVPLPEIIATLQDAIRSNSVPMKLLKTSTSNLAALGHKYNEERFPRLAGTEKFQSSVGNAPSNLAEALLWKLGKWPEYKKFVANYATAEPEIAKKGVVFFAFARHLKDKSNPIYDQHAIRALWAIDANLTCEERQKCKSLLFDGKDVWKPTGSGQDVVGCYEIFVKQINALVPDGGGVVLGEIDRLLMPLGQAIKKSTKTYGDFQALCGWPTAAHPDSSDEV